MKHLSLLSKAIKYFRIQLIVLNTSWRKTIGSSDYSRWSKPYNLKKGWDDRTLLMSQLIEPNTKILEFGAGRMTLKNYLPKNCTYYPSDIVRRDINTIVVDLNKWCNIRFPKVDIIFFSGVLEYINNVENVISKLSNYTNSFLISYATFEAIPSGRRRHGWVNDFSEKQLLKIFENNGFALIKKMTWLKQNIYLFKK